MPSDYLHRIGRTGRAGTEGDAISLVSLEERPLLADIEKLLGHRIEVDHPQRGRAVRPEQVRPEHVTTNSVPPTAPARNITAMPGERFAVRS